MLLLLRDPRYSMFSSISGRGMGCFHGCCHENHVCTSYRILFTTGNVSFEELEQEKHEIWRSRVSGSTRIGFIANYYREYKKIIPISNLVAEKYLFVKYKVCYTVYKRFLCFALSFLFLRILIIPLFINSSFIIDEVHADF